MVLLDGQPYSGRAERIARNEASFRATNEQINALNAAGQRLPTILIVCECGADTCLSTFTVSTRQYTEVRQHPARFLILPGHEMTDVESVVAQHEDFVVVEKLPGEPQRIAEETDPRTAGHDPQSM
jgi:hypothetical protein